MTNSLDAFLWAERQQESGGNYRAVNASSGALGAYQVMPANLPSWTQRALGHTLTPSEYLADPAAQDAVARTILGGYYSKYGPAGAAAAWYSGRPDPTATYGNPPVYKYVASVMALMGSPGAAKAGGLSTGTTGTVQPATDVQQSSDTTGDGCLWGFSIPVVGHVCVLTKGQGRAILGGLLLVSGGIIAGAGLIILASYGLRKSGALDAAASAAGALPGGGALAAPISAASSRVKNGPAPREKKREQRQEQQREQRQEQQREQHQEQQPEEDDDDETPGLGDLVRAAVRQVRAGVTGGDDEA